MTDTAIRVENLSKRYRIGPRERHRALRDVITDDFAASFRCLHENSPFAIRNAFPAAYCLLPCRPLTLHVLRFTIRSLVPLSLRMSKSTWEKRPPLNKFRKCATSPLTTGPRQGRQAGGRSASGSRATSQREGTGEESNLSRNVPL